MIYAYSACLMQAWRLEASETAHCPSILQALETSPLSLSPSPAGEGVRQNSRRPTIYAPPRASLAVHRAVRS